MIYDEKLYYTGVHATSESPLSNYYIGDSTESPPSNYYINGSTCIMTSMYRVVVTFTVLLSY